MQEIQTSKRIYFEFHKNGVLKSEVFENGEEHFYYSNGTLKKRKKPDGTEVFYNRAGQIIKELLPNGVKILYRYNENSATKREIYPNGTIKISKQNI